MYICIYVYTYIYIYIYRYIHLPRGDGVSGRLSGWLLPGCGFETRLVAASADGAGMVFSFHNGTVSLYKGWAVSARDAAYFETRLRKPIDGSA